ncbi:lipoprotein [Spiroplasma endosymbiont of Glossina fuscipes fuscipes]|uniref:lipoprotein n=1 Tax=Spiroplasma endosymbiont of Glossina fuscipes fuscipes TaxID=2004463 RepID=UPI003C77BB43
MKRLLSIIGAISLLGTSTTSLVACNKTQEYIPEELAKLKEENKINTANQEIKDNLEWIAPQEKVFSNLDNNWYYVVWRNSKNSNWRISKFKNDTEISKETGKRIIIKENNEDKLFILLQTEELVKDKFVKFPKDITVLYKENNNNFTWKFSQPSSNIPFKSVYRWNLNTQEPDLIIDDKGNVKVKGE